MKTAIIASSDRLSNEALKQLLHDNYDVRITDNGNNALKMCAAVQPDILILDFILFGISGRKLLHQLQENKISLNVLIFTSLFDNAHVLSALRFNVNGYISRSAAKEDILLAVDTVSDGGTAYDKLFFEKASRPASSFNGCVKPLSQREKKLFKWACEGLTEKQVAQKLNLSQMKVNNDYTVICKRYGCRSRLQFVTTMLKEGFLELSEL